MKALLLAGGRGAHMAPFSSTRPNPMIPVGGRYVIDRTVSMLYEAGINSMKLVVGHRPQMLTKHLSPEHPTGMAIHFIDQGKQNGIGKAMLKARDQFSPGEHFVLVYADTLTASNIISVILQSFSLHNEPTAAICLTRSGEKYGNVYLGKDMKITKIIEKPKLKAGLGNYVLAGVFVLPEAFFGFLEKSKGNMEAALKHLIKKQSLRASIWGDDWLDMAYPWDILKANQMVMDQWKEAAIHQSVELSNTKIKGPVRICEGADIRAGAVLEGPAYIGPGSFIGHNVLLRPYTSVGANSVIGHGAELKNCVIFPETVVGRLSFIGDSVVGEGVDIGAGTMTINRTIDKKEVKIKEGRTLVRAGLNKLGAFIGDGAVIGASNILDAGSMVQAGKKIPHNCSYPAKR
ncbi:MAG TPA: GlmU protein [Nitrospirae bacterium]|nr:GlmU protein [Nitrospirota bacterium]